jgi:spore germination cell wall hydrolase CwlJ-like protein
MTNLRTIVSDKGRAIATFAAAAVMLCVLSLGLSASAGPWLFGASPAARNVIKLTRGDLSEASLLRLARSMDPAAAALAARHDPSAKPQPWGLTPGWESLDMRYRPRLEFQTVNAADALKLNASIPSVAGMLRPVQPFVLPTAAPEYGRALRCLTQAVYYEAALEPTDGQEAVAQVVLNRVRDPNYPNSICGVVYEGAERVTGCQFSFTCDGSLARAPAAWAWKRAQTVAKSALAGNVAGQVGTATHYHADYVLPYWSPTLGKITQIGAHIFYRWRGAAGETAAFTEHYAGREPSINEAAFARPRVAVGKAALQQANATTVVSSETGQTRVIATLGGRRQPTKDDIAAINERLRQFEQANGLARQGTAAPSGVTPLSVTEVGRPAPRAPAAAPPPALPAQAAPAATALPGQ